MKGRGRARELQVRGKLREQGYVVYRLSEGVADLAALKAGAPPLLIQVKSTAQGPFEHFGPADRTALLAEAIAAGADAVLAWWPPRGRLEMRYPNSWPERQMNLLKQPA